MITSFKWPWGNYGAGGSAAQQVNADWQSTSGVSMILNKPSLFSGSYADLSGKPTLFSGVYADLAGKPVLFSGSYNDLTNRPVLFSGAYADLSGKPALFSGAYADLTGKPAIPAQQVNADWLSTSGLSQILNKPALFSGAYSALSGIPSTFAPSAHNQAWSSITATPTTLAGYGITDGLTASALSGYATTAALTAGLSGKFNAPTGTTGQYLRGDGSLATFPAIPAAQVQADWNATSGLSAILNKPTIAAQKRIETYSATTDANGLVTVAYATPFTTVPNVQPGPPSSSEQSWVMVSSTISGFSIRLVQRAVLTVLSVQVLAGLVTNVANAPARVLVVEG